VLYRESILYQTQTLKVLGTCESEIFVPIESRIESAVTIRIRIKSGCSCLRVYSFIHSLCFNKIRVQCRFSQELCRPTNYYRRTVMCGFSWLLKQYCMIAPTLLASMYAPIALATRNSSGDEIAKRDLMTYR